jgi:hypothetical protein
MYSLGGQTPFILRRESGDRYILIGECYVSGVMKGEAMKEHLEGKYEKEVFYIYQFSMPRKSILHIR